ncbi:Gfo/Idh/MocA family protein [Zhihengliuella salsuginis]|uniref:Oxidoreductase n=1 Tax=Zhihengliuella salsuginis TaxID=578222 RepID=A0ABQ3GED0_9MICC|nr:Gfo/Idh/MocA family oxidoreductase [Zhihengliuella salsuginis]GHD03411.1 oxidoreductase [Zhihengliuella salsuginis]
MPAPIRTAVLGFGTSGRIFHAPFLAADPRFDIAVIATSNADRAAAARSEYPQAEVVETPEAALARAADLDLVVVGTPPGTHVDLAAAAIDAGLHVVVDKPFVIRSSDGEELVRLAEAAGVTLTVFQNRRWDADLLTVKRLLDAGELGDPLVFESRFEWWKPGGMRDWKGRTDVADGGGILYDLGPHLIDQAVHLFGPVESVHGEATRHLASPDADADDDAVVLLRHASGVSSRLTMNSVSVAPGPRFHVLGTNATYTKYGLDRQEPQLIAGLRPADDGLGREPEEYWGTLTTPDGSTAVQAERGAYSEFYRLLGDHLESGGPVPVDPRDAIAALEIIERIHGRSRSQRKEATCPTR